jgi:hypothetical protein
MVLSISIEVFHESERPLVAVSHYTVTSSQPRSKGILFGPSRVSTAR